MPAGINRAALLLSLAGHVGLGVVLLLAGGSPEAAGSRRPGGDAGMVWVSLVGEPAPAGTAALVVPADGASDASGRPEVAPDASAPIPRADRAVPVSPVEAVATRAPVRASTPPQAVAPSVAATGPVSVAAAMRSGPAPGADSGRGAGPFPGPDAGATAGGPPDWPGPGDVDRVARPRWPIRPEYPAKARRDGEESQVVVEAWIDAGGAVEFSSVLESGGKAFDVSAVRAVEHSAFRPARLGGRDVASRLALRIHFQLYD